MSLSLIGPCVCVCVQISSSLGLCRVAGRNVAWAALYFALAHHGLTELFPAGAFLGERSFKERTSENAVHPWDK